MWKKYFLLIILLVVSAAIFWGGSRYPELNAKAVSSSNFSASNLINFEQKFEVSKNDPFYKRVVYNGLNWINTNKKGMSFGILFASIILALLELSNFGNPKTTFGSLLLGTTIGAPLGVCVNCASPIGFSLYKSGRNLLTSISTIISSPTLNVIVLSMSFTLFPLYLATTRLLLVVLLIFICLPLLVRNKTVLNDIDNQCEFIQKTELSLFEESKKSLILLINKFWFVIKKTIPLMFLAGFLGSFLMEVLPISFFIDGKWSFFKVVGLSGISVLLPAPMALDIFLGNAFLLSGASGALVLPFVFSLGSYSIYAFFIVSKMTDIKVGLKLFGAVLFLSILGSVGTFYFENSKKELLRKSVGQTIETVENYSSDMSLKEVEFPIPMNIKPESIGTNYMLNSFKYNQKSLALGQFEKVLASKYGVNVERHFTFKHFLPPFYFGVGLSSADINKDGYIDIVFGEGRFLYFIQNSGNLKFSTKKMDLGTGHEILNTAIVDINNDNQLDIIVSSYDKGVFYLLNENGKFNISKLIKLPNLDEVYFTNTLAFSDIDNDGDLDIYLGNFSKGTLTQLPGNTSLDSILINEFPKFVLKPLKGFAGEVHTALFYDFNQDGYEDLFVGNDFDILDRILLNNGKGDFIPPARNILPYSTTTTMSITIADINNDAKDEIYLGQASSSISPLFPKIVSEDNYCLENDSDCLLNIKAKKILNLRNPLEFKQCEQFIDLNVKNECTNMAMLFQALKKDRTVLDCEVFNPDQTFFKDYCSRSLNVSNSIGDNLKEKGYLKERNHQKNILFEYENENYIDKADTFKIEYGGWGWNSQFFDFDNDSFLDLYIANGFWYNSSFPNNIFYHNQRGEKFIERTDDFGLSEFQATGSYLAEDFDNDGDIDIFYYPVNSVPKFFINNVNDKNSISFEITSIDPNKNIIGAEVIISYEGKTQKRMILKSGGFKTIKSKRIIFGLGEAKSIDKLLIKYKSHEILIDKGFKANKIYKVSI